MSYQNLFETPQETAHHNILMNTFPSVKYMVTFMYNAK